MTEISATTMEPVWRSLTVDEKETYYLIDVAKQGDGTDPYDHETRVVTPESVLAQADSMNLNAGSCWLFAKDGKEGYMNPKGNQLAVYDSATGFSGGISMVVQEGHAYFSDENMSLSQWNIEAESVTGHGDVYEVTTAEGRKCYTADR